MKTLSQHHEFLVMKRAHGEEVRSTRAKNLLASSRSIPLHSDAIAEHREKKREQLAAGHANPVDIACDHCGTELVNSGGWRVNTYAVSSVRLDCVGCGKLSILQD